MANYCSTKIKPDLGKAKWLLTKDKTRLSNCSPKIKLDLAMANDCSPKIKPILAIAKAIAHQILKLRLQQVLTRNKSGQIIAEITDSRNGLRCPAKTNSLESNWTKVSSK